MRGREYSSWIWRKKKERETEILLEARKKKENESCASKLGQFMNDEEQEHISCSDFLPCDETYIVNFVLVSILSFPDICP